MSCYNPLQAYSPGVNHKTGKKLIKFKREKPSDIKLALPCGKCIGCRLEKTRQWAIRGMCELVTTKQKGLESSFVTLTYNEKHYPKPFGDLVKKDVQDFVKRLRARHPEISHINDKGQRVSDIRVFYSGEYTPTTQRPHWHLIVYGYDFPDKKPCQVTDAKNLLYTSDELEYGKDGIEPLWYQGFHRIGEVSFDSIRYVAKYITKKLSGDQENEIMEGDFLRAYERFDPITGEIGKVSKEFSEAPRRPGLGSDFLKKYYKEIYPSDTIGVSGKGIQRTVAYFDRLMENIDTNLLEIVLKRRKEYIRSRPEELSYERQKTKEDIQKRKLLKLNSLRKGESHA